MKFQQFKKLLNDFVKSTENRVVNKSTELLLDNNTLYIYNGKTVDTTSDIPYIHGAIYHKCSVNEARKYRKDNKFNCINFNKAGYWLLIHVEHLPKFKDEMPILIKVVDASKHVAPGLFIELGLVFGTQVHSDNPLAVEVALNEKPYHFMCKDCIRTVHSLKIDGTPNKRYKFFRTYDGSIQITLETRRSSLWTMVTKVTVDCTDLDVSILLDLYNKDKRLLFEGEVFKRNKMEYLYKYLVFEKSAEYNEIKPKLQDAFNKCKPLITALGVHTPDVLGFLLFVYCNTSPLKIVEFFQGDYNCKIHQLYLIHPVVFKFSWKSKYKLKELDLVSK